MSTAVQDDYAIEIDQISTAEWRHALGTLSDANIYQTWDYPACCHPRSGVSRLVLRYQEKVVAAVQIRIVSIPILGRGIAHIRWGPVWRARDEPPNHIHFRRCIDAVIAEYAVRRKLAVEIVPAPIEKDWPELERILVDAGFIEKRRSPTKRTIMMNLEPSLEELYNGLHKKWRNCLNYARRAEQEVVEGDSVELFEEFRKVYDKMRARKSFETSMSLSAFAALQRRLTSEQKMKVFICRSGADVCAGAIVSLQGDTGVYLFGASDGPGLDRKSSYLVQWRVIAWLKENQARRYDLNGFNQVTNPGGYAFKSRLAGRNGEEVSSRPIAMAHSPVSRLLVAAGEASVRAVRKARHALARRNSRIRPE